MNDWFYYCLMYLFIAIIVAAIYVKIRIDEPLSKKESARGILLSVFWPLSVVGLILYGLWWVPYYAFFSKEDE